MCVEVNIVSAAFMYVLSCLFSSHAAATYLGALIMLGMLLFSGLLLNLSSVPAALSWLRYLSYYSYGYESLVTNELDGISITISIESVASVDLSGNIFLQAFALSPNNFWMNVAILFGMIIIYLGIGFLLISGKISALLRRCR